MSFYPRQLSTIIFITRSSSFLSGEYNFSEKEGNPLTECSDMTVMGNVIVRRSAVCLHTCSISVSNAYKLVESEFTNSLLSFLVPSKDPPYSSSEV